MSPSKIHNHSQWKLGYSMNASWPILMGREIFWSNWISDSQRFLTDDTKLLSWNLHMINPLLDRLTRFDNHWKKKRVQQLTIIEYRPRQDMTIYTQNITSANNHMCRKQMFSHIESRHILTKLKRQAVEVVHQGVHLIAHCIYETMWERLGMSYCQILRFSCQKFTSIAVKGIVCTATIYP